MIYGNSIGGLGLERTYLLVDEAGNEVPAVMVDKETTLDATENDIRLGSTAVTADGVTEGKKYIPAYHTTEGIEFVPAGSEVKITNLSSEDAYDFTKLQAIICPYNSSIEDSVAAEKVAIDGNVYAAQSAEVVATITKDSEAKSISLGITNVGTVPLIIRYFTYKEEA